MKFADVRRKAFARLPAGAARIPVVTYGTDFNAFKPVVLQPAVAQPQNRYEFTHA